MDSWRWRSTAFAHGVHELDQRCNTVKCFPDSPVSHQRPLYLVCKKHFPKRERRKMEKVVNLANRARRSLDGLSTRRLLIIILVTLAILIYIGPLLFRRMHNSIKPYSNDALTLCLQAKIRNFQDDLDSLDAVIMHTPSLIDDKPFMPYVGNGKLGIGVMGNKRLHIKGARALSLAVEFYPIAEFSLQGGEQKEVYIIQYKTGLVYRYQCIKIPQSSMCVTVDHIFYAHRTRPSVLVHEVELYNPMDSTLTALTHLVGSEQWKAAATIVQRFNGGGSGSYHVTTGRATSEDGQELMVVIASSRLSPTVSIEPKSTVRFKFTHVVEYAPYLSQDGEVQQQQMEKAVRDEMNAVQTMTAQLLRDEHVKVWSTLWQSGFSISCSMAPNSLNGDRINATMYYAMSNSRAPLHERQTSAQEKQRLEMLLVGPDRCYDGHHTLHTSDLKLWGSLTDEADIARLSSVWFLTLDKQGCHQLLQAGADGVIQAMVLSYGGLKYTNHHLSFWTHPRDLHRNYHFRRILYGNGTHINITVQVREEDNKAILLVALDRKDKTYWACDAGCIDTPVELSSDAKAVSREADGAGDGDPLHHADGST
ncbi:PREDICTED: uncharacterized protein KIAA2013 homolog [Priapulus caudatus]|uniref:Uncharacterized protein KIAA2013 homolog n=1 Tax=Priapulus caudatus TaxID=37621 RepID=A0ABM1DX34_PRICU|nr:PREDICTED: uncharacterized protein KIAA2013 homolog [Priapulus caudatus]